MPDHWQPTTLGEAADVEMGQSPPGDTYNANGDGLPFLQGSAEFGDRYPEPDRWCSSPTRIAEPGDLLVSVRAPVGDTNFADRQLAFGRGLARIRSTSSASSDFLRLVIQSEIGRLNRNAGGGMFASITARNLRGFEVALPPSHEQGRIVDLIGSIDTYIDALGAQIEATRTARFGVLSELLSNPGEDWRSTTLGQIAKLVGGQAFPRKEQGGLMGLPFIKVSDMNRPGNEIGITDAENFVTAEQVERMRLRISPAGTVVFPKVGAALMTEKRRMLTVPTVFDNNIMGLVASHEVLPEFLFFWMQTVRLGQWAQEGAVPSVNNGIVGNLEIALPPLAEQQRIVDLVGSVDEQTTTLNSQVPAVRELRSGVLSELLSGDRLLTDDYEMAVGL